MTTEARDNGIRLARVVDLGDETPLDLTKKVRDISVTERNGFKTCRRRWYLDTLENLTPAGTITWYYEFGTGLHLGLEQYYKAFGRIHSEEGIDPVRAALIGFNEWYEEMDTEILTGDYGNATSQYRNELLEYRDLGIGMLKNYGAYAALEDTFTVCCVEGVWTPQGIALLGDDLLPPYDESVHPVLLPSGRFMVPIVDPSNDYQWLEGEPYLSSRLDLIVYEKRTGWRGFWVGDHKSAGSKPSDRGIDMDDQITGYSYTLWRHTGIFARGCFFNYLIKQLPKPPRLVREDTALSTAKDQLTTADWYKEAMEEFGLIANGRMISKKHEECYASLRAYGWSRFFNRARVTRNQHEIKMFELRLPEEYADMLITFQDPGHKAYPHLSQYNCDGCAMGPICHAIEDGSDYESVIENRYKQGKDRKAA